MRPWSAWFHLLVANNLSARYEIDTQLCHSMASSWRTSCALIWRKSSVTDALASRPSKHRKSVATLMHAARLLTYAGYPCQSEREDGVMLDTHLMGTTSRYEDSLPTCWWTVNGLTPNDASSVSMVFVTYVRCAWIGSSTPEGS